METNIRVNKKKILLPIAAILLTAGIVIAVVLIVRSNDTQRKLNEQLELGARYLAELDYDRAVSAYGAALEIDPLNTEAYIGLSNAYSAQGKYEEASELLKQGFELNADPKLSEQAVSVSLEWTDTLVAQELYEEAILHMTAALEWTGDGRIRTRVEEVEELIRRKEEDREWQELCNAFLKKVSEYMDTGDRTAMVALEDSEERLPVVQGMNDRGIDHIILDPEGNGADFSGKSSGIYIKNRRCYYYNGEFVNGLREGHGTFGYYRRDSETAVFEGEWKNDKANGEGFFTEYEGDWNRTTRGNFTNDLQNGHMIHEVTFVNAELIDSMGPGTISVSYDVVDGIAGQFPGWEKRNDDTDYVAVYNESHTAGFSWSYKPEKGQRLGLLGRTRLEGE